MNQWLMQLDKPRSTYTLSTLPHRAWEQALPFVLRAHTLVRSEELDRYKRDAERRLRQEAKAAARKGKPSGSSKSGGGSGGSSSKGKK
jgi:hypothetical protein